MEQRVPSTQQYKAAFQTISPLPESYMDMLRAHYAAPDHTITATGLSRMVGFKNYNASNLHYGRLGRQIRERIDWQPTMPLAVLVTFDKPGSEWLWTMRPQVAQALEELNWVKAKESFSFPEEIPQSVSLAEGAISRVPVNKYERSSKARRLCIAHHGTSCSICSFDFGEIYGEVAEGYIHVHHLLPLSEMGAEYEVDPVEHLRPVCPNCHAVLHLRTPAFDIEEVMLMVRKQQCD